MPLSFDKSFEDDLIRRFWRFVTGDTENNDPFKNSKTPEVFFDLPLNLYDSYIFYQANFEEIDQICFDRVDPSYLLNSTPWNSTPWNSNDFGRSQELLLIDYNLTNDISLQESISEDVNLDVKNTFNRALIKFTEQSWIGKGSLPSINYISYKLPQKIYFDLEQKGQSVKDN